MEIHRATLLGVSVVEPFEPEGSTSQETDPALNIAKSNQVQRGRVVETVDEGITLDRLGLRLQEPSIFPRSFFHLDRALSLEPIP